MSALTNEQELAAIRARHVQHEGPCASMIDEPHCQEDADPWPCDTAQVLAALDAASRREAELVAALESVIRLTEPIPHSVDVEQAGMQAGVAIAAAREALAKK